MPKQSISEIRKKEILTTFYEIAKKEGLDKTSFAMIAQELEIQPSLIVHYFKNRSELIDSLIQYNLDQYEIIFLLDKEPARYTSSRKKLIKLIDRLFSKEWDNLFDDGVFYNCYALSYRDQRIKAKFRALHFRIRESIEKVIIECKYQDELKVDNPQELAQHISNLMDGAYYYVGMLENRQRQNEYMASIKKLVIDLLNWKEKKNISTIV